MSYVYQHVKVLRVIDGDTVELSVDLGAHIVWRDSFRLAGIDTPERGQPMYHEATEYLSKLLLVGLSKIETIRPDKYGRYLVRLWIPVSGGDLCVNDVMVTEGFAKEYWGGAKVP